MPIRRPTTTCIISPSSSQGGDGENVPTRLHRADVVADVLRRRQDHQCGAAKFKEEGRGVIVYLRDGSAGVPDRRRSRTGLGSAGSRAMARSRLGRADPRDLDITSIVVSRPSRAPISASAASASSRRSRARWSRGAAPIVVAGRRSRCRRWREWLLELLARWR